MTGWCGHGAFAESSTTQQLALRGVKVPGLGTAQAVKPGGPSPPGSDQQANEQGSQGSHFAGQALVTDAALAVGTDAATTRRRDDTTCCSLRRSLPAGGAALRAVAGVRVEWIASRVSSPRRLVIHSTLTPATPAGRPARRQRGEPLIRATWFMRVAATGSGSTSMLCIRPVAPVMGGASCHRVVASSCCPAGGAVTGGCR